jgi:hypothetical protein
MSSQNLDSKAQLPDNFESPLFCLSHFISILASIIIRLLEHPATIAITSELDIEILPRGDCL